MKQKKFLLRMVLMVVLMLTMVGNTALVKATNTNDAKRMNVVFVMDESGSMKSTDAGELRYQAMELFLGLAADTGNYMGAVAFDTEIILKQDIVQMNGKGAKENLAQTVRATDSNGDTNIGKAIETATQMLEEQGNSKLSSAIILLSDGNTDLKSQEEFDKSIESKEKAIETARANGYKIYSVCLNANGEADKAELQEISEATGAVSMEVKSAEDLKDVFNYFYDIIYSTETVVLGDEVIPESGELEIPFSIPRIGVEEANIIITTLNPNTKYTLFKPDGIAYTEKEMEEVQMTIDTFSVLKIMKPEYGDWKLRVVGIPGDNVKVEMVYNAELSVQFDVNGGNFNCETGKDIPFAAKLLEKGAEISDTEVYQEYTFKIVLTDTATNTTEEFDMNMGPDGGSYTHKISEAGEYEVYAALEIDAMKLFSENYTLKVTEGQTTTPTPPPTPEPTELEDTSLKITKLSIFAKKDFVADLASGMDGMDLSTVDSTIKNSDFDSTVASVSGTDLSINLKEVGKGGELTVEAADANGNTINVIVTVKIISIVLILVILLAIILIMIILITAIKKGGENGPINGKIMILPYTENGTLTPETYEGTKGKMYIARYLNVREDIGIDMKNTYFMTGGKKNSSYIYLVSKKGYYTDMTPDRKEKKIRLDSNMPVDISSDMDLTKGMKVTYISDSMGY